MNDLAPLVLTFVLVGYSIILHEIAHGYAALKFGDPTAERNGRLSMSPLDHIDPIGTVLFPLIQLAIPPHRVYLGWAKPVPVNHANLEPRVAGDVVVSLAGVIVNLAIAVAMAILLGFERVVPAERYESNLFHVLVNVMDANLGLLVFNLLPIPPLDGSHVMKYLLPADIRERYERIGFQGTVILLVLIASGALRPITGPIVGFLSDLLWTQVTLRIRGWA